ncbi:MAG: ATP-binding cassette domain-containing protein [Rubritalea sp.]|uniref:ATP-binding cassette domain-containing protein n=1 Tax=Rubritalea sp. TaxID=2109375 RepID=UPI0032423188
MDEACRITIPSGYGIGYGKGTIASAKYEIKLGQGTHYLLARNGRGKTTLLRSIAGSLSALVGRAYVRGNVQFVPEDIEYNDHLSAKVILKALLPSESLQDCLAFAERIELDVNKNYRDLSTGNKRKISWLMAEFSCSKDGGDVLLLDEPFTGVDSYVRNAFMEYWSECQSGVCRLVSCHPDFDSMGIHSAVLISDGEITHTGSNQGKSWGELKGALI